MEIKRYEGNQRMSKAVVHNNTVYLSGQVHAEGDVKEQTAQVLAKIEDLLNKYNSDKEHILSVTIYLKDIDNDFANMNSVWDEWIPEGFKPARACVEAKMARECLLVEMSVIAATK
ncbi:RidA family protein [Clostridium sp. CCUG 7971]|uniref:RidA family protein n=1 Tax=Clostridium sp. CCUG 7971 TaxID=2811414 RepID=UPI001ABA057C|nr:RidA family protein [Clostridium sp. CCUG 7971]MBO3446413.1 RidA family protein [Clostridium sp. CCUG 7971]